MFAALQPLPELLGRQVGAEKRAKRRAEGLLVLPGCLLSVTQPCRRVPPVPADAPGKGRNMPGSVPALGGSLQRGFWLWGEARAGLCLALGSLVVVLLFVRSAGRRAALGLGALEQ